MLRDSGGGSWQGRPTVWAARRPRAAPGSGVLFAAAEAMPEVTTKQLEALLLEIRGAQALSFMAETDARLNKTDNPWRCPHCGESAVRKLAYVHGIVNVDYAAAVNRQRRRERGLPANPPKSHAARNSEPIVKPFIPSVRSWGKRVADTPLVEYHGRHYLNLKREQVKWVKFTLHGVELTAKQLAVMATLQRQRNSESRGQQLRREIVWRDYTTTNIIWLRMRGQHYDVQRPKRRRRKQAA